MNGPAASFQHDPHRFPPPTACRAESPGYVRMLIVSRLQPVYYNSSSRRASSGGFLAELADIRLQEHQELPSQGGCCFSSNGGEKLKLFGGGHFGPNETLPYKENITSLSGTAAQQACLSSEVSVLLEFSILFLFFYPPIPHLMTLAAKRKKNC